MLLCVEAGSQIKDPDRGVGGRAGRRVPGAQPEVPAVRGAAVGAAPGREGEGEAGEGKAASPQASHRSSRPEPCL